MKKDQLAGARVALSCTLSALFAALAISACGSGTTTSAPPGCGDAICQSSENCQSCPADCGTCPVFEFCGDQTCQATEDCSTCPIDCGGQCCGNGTCQPQFNEDCGTCPADCGACCG